MAENNIVHIEFRADDLDGAERFYGKLFSWKIFPSGEAYRVFDSAGGVGGGFFQADEFEQRVRCYIEVADIEAKLKEIEAAGGRVACPKTKISDEYGYFALFTDTVGNLMGLWCQT